MCKYETPGDVYPVRVFFGRGWVKKVDLFTLKYITMTTDAIREKLISYVQMAEEKKIRAIYTMVEDDMHTEENDWTNEFESEMNQRSNEVTEGVVSTYSWEETKQAAIAAVKNKQNP